MGIYFIIIIIIVNITVAGSSLLLMNADSTYWTVYSCSLSAREEWAGMMKQKKK